MINNKIKKKKKKKIPHAGVLILNQVDTRRTNLKH